MRIIESFGGWNLMKVDESTKAAKEYMFQRAASKMRKEPTELSPEERDRILKDPLYLEISEIGKAYPNYITALLKFAYEHKASVDQIRSLLNDFQTKKALISQLGSPQQLMDDYANREPAHGVFGFEQLTDEIQSLERIKSAKWFIDAMPLKLRQGLRSLSREELAPIIDAALTLSDLGENTVKMFFLTIKAHENDPIKDFVRFVIEYVDSFSDKAKANRLQKVDDFGDQTGVLYYDGTILALSIRTAAASAGVCAGADWCITRGSFDSSNYGGGNNVQLAVFNFGLKADDPMAIVGYTVTFDGKLTYAHDRGNKSVISGNNMAENFKRLGYPNAMIDAIQEALPLESAVKTAIYKLNLDKGKPLDILFSVITQTYDLEYTEEAGKIISNLVKDRISTLITEADMDRAIQKYKEKGILSQISAEVAKALFAKADPAVMKELVDSTLEAFAEIRMIVKEDPSLMNARIANVLSQQDEVLKALGLTGGDVEAVMEYISRERLTEFKMAEPAVKPRTAPTIAPTRPMPKRPGPVPSKQPFKAPEPAKAEAEDVISRYEELTKNQEEQ